MDVKHDKDNNNAQLNFLTNGNRSFASLLEDISHLDDFQVSQQLLDYEIWAMLIDYS